MPATPRFGFVLDPDSTPNWGATLRNALTAIENLAAKTIDHYTKTESDAKNAIIGKKVGEIFSHTGISAPAGSYAAPVAPTNISRSAYAALWAAIHKESVVAISIATPGVVSWVGHGLSNGMPIVLYTTGALPTGLTAGTVYYIVNAAADSFQLSATVGGAAIDTSGSQSGVHTAVCAPWGVGDGSTTFGSPYAPANYAMVAANGNVGTQSVGEVIAHPHWQSSITAGTGYNGGGYNGQGPGTAGNTATSSTGGPANLAAGVRVLFCVQYQ